MTIEQQRGFAASHGFNDGSMARAVFVGPRMSLTAANADDVTAAFIWKLPLFLAVGGFVFVAVGESLRAMWRPKV